MALIIIMVIEEVAINYLVIIIVYNLDKLIKFKAKQKYMYYENDEEYYKVILRLHHHFNMVAYKLSILNLLQEY